MSIKVKQIILAIIACFLWSTAFVGIKYGLPYTTPINFAGMRFIIAGLITLIFMGNYRENFSAIKSNFIVVVKVGFLQTFLLYLFFYLGLSRISGALGSVVTGFSPLWGIVLAHFLMKNDRLNPKKFFSLILGLTGIAVFAFGQGKEVGTVDLLGLFFMIGASFSSGLSSIIVAKDRGRVPAIALNGAQLLWGGVILTIMSYSFEDIVYPVDLRYYGALFYLSLLSAVAFSIWFHLLKAGAKISSLNLWKFIIPVSGAVLSWMILPDESPTWKAVGGMTLVGAAIIIYYAKWRRR